MAAFAFVHAQHSPALLRRIERPALPTAALRALGRALARTEVKDGIHLLVLGRVREDVIPQVADLGLQAEGAEWAIAAGIVGADLVFSVRNVGYVRAAGEVVRGSRRGARRRRRTPLDGEGDHPAEGVPKALRQRHAHPHPRGAARGVRRGDLEQRLAR